MPENSRRDFLRYLAGSPLLAPLLTSACGREGGNVSDTVAGTAAEPDEQFGALIARAASAIDVFDFRVTARRRLPPAHYAYIASGVDADATLRANRAAFERVQIRNRRLVGVENVHTATTILGTAMETPIIVAPAGSQRAFHADGELATARAAKSQNHLMMLSTVATTSVEDVAAARGAPVWYQLYPTSRWEITERMLRRAEAAGSPVVVLTVDNPVGGNRTSLARGAKRDRRNCAQCHAANDSAAYLRKPMFDGTGMRAENWETPMHTWEFVDRLKAATSMGVVIKGIVSAEDAAECIVHGVDGIVVSNHGGRAEESGRGTLECLPEVVRAVSRRIPVILDSGIRRGTDIFKAMALGADAVAIGRPYLWGLGAFGQEGVEHVLRILRAELLTAMQLAGTRSLAEITADRVASAFSA